MSLWGPLRAPTGQARPREFLSGPIGCVATSETKDSLCGKEAPGTRIVRAREWRKTPKECVARRALQRGPDRPVRALTQPGTPPAQGGKGISMVTLQFRVKNGGISVRPRGWTGNTASVMENGLRAQLATYQRRGRAYQLSLDEAKSFITGLVVFAAACPQALQLNGVGQVMAFDGGVSFPRAPDKPPVHVDLWVEGEALCAQVVEGRWFEKDLAADMPEGTVADEDGVWRLPLGPQSYRLLVFLGVIRACYPQTLHIRGLQNVLADIRARRIVAQ